MKFFVDNWLLILIALSSGGMLAWPRLRGAGQGSLTVQGAVHIINREREEHRGEAADVRRRMRHDLQAGTIPRPRRPRRDDQAPLLDILNRVGIVLSPEQQRHLEDLLHRERQ